MGTFVPCGCWKAAAVLRILQSMSQPRERAPHGRASEEQLQRLRKRAHFADPESGRHRDRAVG
ncbi:hypothetical protein GCM10017708_21550 [Arthrobacter citreus]